MLICYMYCFFFVFQVASQKQTLRNVTDYITDVICKRAKTGYNYGVILIPEGLIDFIPEVFLSAYSSWSLVICFVICYFVCTLII